MYTLEELEAEYLRMERTLSEPGLLADKSRYTELTREFTNLSRLLHIQRRLREIEREVQEYVEMLKGGEDETLKKEIHGEIERLEREREETARRFELALIPENPLDGKNIIMEIRAGTGGEEAALFAADLFRMYSRYCERQGWRIEILSGS